MTTEEKAVLIAECKAEIEIFKQWLIWHEERGLECRVQKSQLMRQEIALAALTAEPVGKFIQWDSGDEETGPEIEWVEANTKESIPLYKCAPVAVPEGWRMVPVEPTDEQWQAAHGMFDVQRVYRAMIAAAPAP